MKEKNHNKIETMENETAFEVKEESEREKIPWWDCKYRTIEEKEREL